MALEQNLVQNRVVAPQVELVIKDLGVARCLDGLSLGAGLVDGITSLIPERVVLREKYDERVQGLNDPPEINLFPCLNPQSLQSAASSYRLRRLQGGQLRRAGRVASSGGLTLAKPADTETGSYQTDGTLFMGM